MKKFVDFVTENFIESNGHLEATNNSFIPQIEVQDVIVELRGFSTLEFKFTVNYRFSKKYRFLGFWHLLVLEVE